MFKEIKKVFYEMRMKVKTFRFMKVYHKSVYTQNNSFNPQHRSRIYVVGEKIHGVIDSPSLTVEQIKKIESDLQKYGVFFK